MRQEFPVYAQDESRPTEQVDDESTQFRDDPSTQVGQASDERRGGQQYRDDYAHIADEVGSFITRDYMCKVPCDRCALSKGICDMSEHTLTL